MIDPRKQAEIAPAGGQNPRSKVPTNRCRARAGQNGQNPIPDEALRRLVNSARRLSPKGSQTYSPTHLLTQIYPRLAPSAHSSQFAFPNFPRPTFNLPTATGRYLGVAWRHLPPASRPSRPRPSILPSQPKPPRLLNRYLLLPASGKRATRRLSRSLGQPPLCTTFATFPRKERCERQARREQPGTQHSMRTQQERLEDHQAVRNHVNQVLCELEDLEPEHFPLSERTLERAGAPCAVMFVLHGPRQLQVTAVWELSSGVIWFYNAVGERCAKTQLAA